MSFEIAPESEHEIARERASFEKAPLLFWKARPGDAVGSSFSRSLLFGGAFYHFSLPVSHFLKKSIWRRPLEKLGNNARQVFDEAAAI